MNKDSEATCKGSFSLGTACGTCSKCWQELEKMKTKNPTTIQYILFGSLATNKPTSCYHVGLMGCTEIRAIYHGPTEMNMPVFSYDVHFENGQVITVSHDTFYVSEGANIRK